MLEKYGHGGDLRTAEETFGRQPQPFLDFSSNMNPFGPPPVVRDILRGFADRIDAYPDPAVRRLTARLAERHGVPPEAVLTGNGAAELIDLAARAVRPALTALAQPCFAEYGDAVRKAGGAVREIRLSPERQFRLTADELELAMEPSGARPDAWFIGSPNNPTGQPVDGSLVERLLAEGRVVLLDEAFLDFLPDEEARSFIRRAARTPGLIVIRSMTKFYAVPGIRLGYAVGEPETMKRLRGLQVPWSVNALAQEIGCAVLEERTYAARTIAWLAEERPWLADRLRGLGLKVFSGAANYILFALPPEGAATAGSLQAAMGRQGVLIRDASRFPGLDGRYCRVAVKLRADNERLLAALAHALQELQAPSGGRRPAAAEGAGE